MRATMSKTASQGSRNGTKTLQVCEGCRLRKIRCDTADQGCRNCRHAGIECVRTANIRFKNADPALRVFPVEQVWHPLKSSLRFHDETPELIDFYHGEDSETGRRLIYGRPATQWTSFETTSGTDNHEHSSLNVPNRSSTYHVHERVPADADTHNYSNKSLISATRTDESPSTLPPALNELNSLRQEPASHPSRSEALLLRNFTENMALWADGPDPQRSFELEASRLALTEPVLKHAICAFSSRHIHRHGNHDAAEALEHQSKCLELLIPAMSGERPVSESVLAAVAILRQNEEMDEFDNRFHLEGVTQMLNDSSTFSFSGGLGEATAWLCLREDLYVSLTTQTAIRTNLAPFEAATWIQGESDSSRANQMVLLLAKLLSVAFLEVIDATALADIEADLARWDMTKSCAFEPVYFLPRDPSAGRFLPEVWMLASPHAIGLQYYHIAKLILAVSDRPQSTRSFDYVHQHRAIEKRVRHHLLQAVGIAKSNARVQNTWFTAHHCLSVWGVYLRHKGDQQACLAFLRDMEYHIGWRNTALIERLSMQWGDDSE